MATIKTDAKVDNGKRTMRFAERPGYAERKPKAKKKKKVAKNAVDDKAKTIDDLG